MRDPGLLKSRLESEEATNPGNTLVISHENSLGRAFIPGEPGLYPHARRCAEGLRAATTGFDVRVVFYVRPVADFAESYYLQTIHEGASHSFDEWVAELEPHTWQWQPVVDALDAAFGSERVFVGDFMEVMEGQKSMLRGFMQRAGLESPSSADLSYRPVRNASISARGLALALDVNPLLRKDRNEPHEMRKFLQKHLSNQRFERARPLPPSMRHELGDGDYQELVERAHHGLSRSAHG